MNYSKKVIQYFNDSDTREQEDLASQIEEGVYAEELSSLSDSEIDRLVSDLRENNDLSAAQMKVLKKIDHIGAAIILASKEL